MQDINSLINFQLNCIHVVLLGFDSNNSVDDLADNLDSVFSGLLDKHARFRAYCARCVLISLGLTMNARKLGGRLYVGPDPLRSPLLLQRLNNPDAQPCVEIVNCRI